MMSGIAGTPRVSVVLTDGYGVGSALRRRLTDLGGGGRTSKLRSSPVLCLEGLRDVSAVMTSDYRTTVCCGQFWSCFDSSPVVVPVLSV